MKDDDEEDISTPVDWQSVAVVRLCVQFLQPIRRVPRQDDWRVKAM